MVDCLLVGSDVVRAHESILGVLDELAEIDHKTPRERSVCLQTLEQDGANLFFHNSVLLAKENDQNHAEVKCVAIWVSELVDNTVKETQSCLVVEIGGHLLEQFNVVVGSCFWRTLFFLVTYLGDYEENNGVDHT